MLMKSKLVNLSSMVHAFGVVPQSSSPNLGSPRTSLLFLFQEFYSFCVLNSGPWSFLTMVMLTFFGCSTLTEWNSGVNVRVPSQRSPCRNHSGTCGHSPQSDPSNLSKLNNQTTRKFQRVIFFSKGENPTSDTFLIPPICLASLFMENIFIAVSLLNSSTSVGARPYQKSTG